MQNSKGLMDRLLNIDTVDAHCDIPCAIYDPSTALIAALSVVRLIDIFHDAAGGDGGPKATNTMARAVMRKEEEAEKVKHEVRIIWGDYFKPPHMEAHPKINEIAHGIMLKASACKQGVSRDDGLALVELVNDFADIFWATKDVATERVTSPYPPALDVVRAKL